MGPSCFSTDTHQVKIVQVMCDDGVHVINITLATCTFTIEDVHGATESRIS